MMKLYDFQIEAIKKMKRGCILCGDVGSGKSITSLMTFAMGNCITLEDTNGNRKLFKKRYEEKIDAVAAMMDAYIAYKINREQFD